MALLYQICVLTDGEAPFTTRRSRQNYAAIAPRLHHARARMRGAPLASRGQGRGDFTAMPHYHTACCVRCNSPDKICARIFDNADAADAFQSPAGRRRRSFHQFFSPPSTAKCQQYCWHWQCRHVVAAGRQRPLAAITCLKRKGLPRIVSNSATSAARRTAMRIVRRLLICHLRAAATSSYSVSQSMSPSHIVAISFSPRHSKRDGAASISAGRRGHTTCLPHYIAATFHAALLTMMNTAYRPFLIRAMLRAASRHRLACARCRISMRFRPCLMIHTPSTFIVRPIITSASFDDLLP